MSKSIIYDSIVDNQSTGRKVPMLLEHADIYDSVEKAVFNWTFEDSARSCSTTTATTHIFRYSVGLLSGWWLELTPDASAVWDNGHYWIGTAIEEVELITGGKVFMKYTGDQLQEYTWFFNNKFGPETRTHLKTLMDAGSGATGALSVFCPILCPGQSCVLGEKNQPINLNLSQSPFDIKIKIRAGNVISKTNALVINRVRLHRREWQVPEDQAKAYNKFSMVDFNYISDLTETLTINTSSNRTIQQAFDSTGNAECLGLFVRAVRNADVNTEFERFVGQELTELKLQVNNQDLYIHGSTQQARFMQLIDNASLPFDSNSTSFQYFIPLVPHLNPNMKPYKNKGHHGISLSKVIPKLITTCSAATGTYQLFISSINKCTFVIENGVGSLVR